MSSSFKDIKGDLSYLSKFKAKYNMIAAIIIGLICIIFGIIFYTKKDDSSISESKRNEYKKNSTILLIVGPIIIFIGTIHFYLVNRYEKYAQITGFTGLLGSFK